MILYNYKRISSCGKPENMLNISLTLIYYFYIIYYEHIFNTNIHYYIHQNFRII